VQHKTKIIQTNKNKESFKKNKKNKKNKKDGGWPVPPSDDSRFGRRLASFQTSKTPNIFHCIVSFEC